MCATVHRMITYNARPSQKDGRTHRALKTIVSNGSGRMQSNRYFIYLLTVISQLFLYDLDRHHITSCVRHVWHVKKMGHSSLRTFRTTLHKTLDSKAWGLLGNVCPKLVTKLPKLWTTIRGFNRVFCPSNSSLILVSHNCTHRFLSVFKMLNHI